LDYFIRSVYHLDSLEQSLREGVYNYLITDKQGIVFVGKIIKE
jgi:hypothetical protein